MIENSAPFYLVAFAQLIYIVLQGNTSFYTAREGIVAALLLTVQWMFVLWLLLHVEQMATWKKTKTFVQRPLAIFFILCACIQVVHISTICRREYQSGGVWILLLVVGLLALPIHWHALCRMHQTLWAFSIFSGILLSGLISELCWKNLSYAPLDWQRIGHAWNALFLFCPEFLALPWIRHAEKNLWCKLPILIFVLQVSVVTTAEAYFGWAEDVGRFPSMEAIRCCGIGAFSRLDDVFIGLWLLLALYRIAVIGQLVKALWTEGARITDEKE